MKRKNKKEIQKYYQINDVASTYDNRRFVGKGGEYINSTEVSTTLNVMKKSLGVDSPKVLDLGSGQGRLSIPLKKAGYNTYCLDSSESMLSFLTKEFGRDHIYIQSVFDKIPSSTKFDGVTSLRFFDHFDEADQIKILINGSKSLKKGGMFFLSGLSSHSLEYIVSFLFPYGRYNYYLSPTVYAKIFAKAGLRLTTYESAFFIPRGVFLHTNNYPAIQKALISIDSFMTRILPSFGAMKIFVLEK